MSIVAQCVHGAGVCVIPSPRNDHRPYLIRHKPLAAVAALLVLSKVLAFGILALTPTTASLSTITTARIVQLTNNERSKAGLASLTSSPLLMEAARQKAAHLLDEDYFAHVSPSGVTPWFWMDKAGYTYLVAGENLAIDFFEAESVVAAWLNSPSHKENMLHSDYTETGVAVLTGEFQGGTSTVVVHMFGRPLASVSPPSSTPPPPLPVPETVPQEVVPLPRVAPATPRIALISEVGVRSQVAVMVEGEVGSTVSITVNEATLDQFLLPDAQPVRRTLDVSAWPDGPLVLQAFSTREDVRSTLSAPVSIQKDTVGPTLHGATYAFLPSPLTDDPRAVFIPPQGSFASLALRYEGQPLGVSLPRGYFFIPIRTGELELQAEDEVGNSTELVLASPAPHFSADTAVTVGATAGSREFSSLTRRLALGIGLSVLVLLGLAIVVRIRVQHLDLIAHGTLVFLLAASLFLW